MGVYVASEVAKGLDHAHRRRDEQMRPLGIVHRDVSPQNVLLSFEGEVKVTDFGIAKARGALDQAAPEDTRSRKLQGKFGYMSPEQARGESVDARSDLFSLGTMLYECVAGVNPFSAPTTFETLRRVQACEYPPVELLRPDAPPELVAILKTAMAKDPGRPLPRRRAHVRGAPRVPLRAGQPLRRARPRRVPRALPRLEPTAPRRRRSGRRCSRRSSGAAQHRAHARRGPGVAPGVERARRERAARFAAIERAAEHGRAARGDGARHRAAARHGLAGGRPGREHRRALGRARPAARGGPHRGALRPRRPRRARHRDGHALRARRAAEPRRRAARPGAGLHVGRIHVSATGEPTEDERLGTLLDTARDLARVREGMRGHQHAGHAAGASRSSSSSR